MPLMFCKGYSEIKELLGIVKQATSNTPESPLLGCLLFLLSLYFSKDSINSVIVCEILRKCSHPLWNNALCPDYCLTLLQIN